MTQTGVVAGSGRLTDWISLGVLASSVPRDAVDEAIEVTGARGINGELRARAERAERDLDAARAEPARARQGTGAGETPDAASRHRPGQATE